MSTTRITISVPERLAAKAQRAVDAGQADSVSGYFAELAEREPDWADARAVLAFDLDDLARLDPRIDLVVV